VFLTGWGSGARVFHRDPLFFLTLPPFVREDETNIQWGDPLDKVIIFFIKKKEPKLPGNQVSEVKGMIARPRKKPNASRIFRIKSDCPAHLGKELLLPIIFRGKRLETPRDCPIKMLFLFWKWLFVPSLGKEAI